MLFRLKSLPSGTGYCLTTGKSEEINNFLKIVYPFVSQIPSMLYKADLTLKIANYTEELQGRYGKEITITTVNPDASSRNYSEDEVNKIINFLGQGISITEIAKELNRSYFGVYDKIKRLKIKD